LKKKDDFYIAMLKYGKDSIETGVSFSDTRKFLISQGYSFDESQLKRAFRAAFYSNRSGFVKDSGDDFCHMKMEAYLHLLDNNESVRNKRESYFTLLLSMFAIILSAFTLFLVYGFPALPSERSPSKAKVRIAAPQKPQDWDENFNYLLITDPPGREDGNKNTNP